jgi:hypothetical protein
MSNQHITDLVIVGCAALGVITFMALIAVPAMLSYRRVWERAVALVLSMYVLAAFAGIGVLLGALIVYEWPRLF